MSLRRLLLLSLSQFWRTNLGVAVGLAVATTVITGALIVGDSMRYSLQQIAEQRLGEVDYAVVGGDRFFSNTFANAISDDAGGAIMLQAVVSTPDNKARANNVVIIGCDPPASRLIGLPANPQPGEAFLNPTLARQLGATIGETLIIRVPEPSALPIDAALVNASKPALALRVKVAQIVDRDQGGRFSLRAEQREPMTLFVDRDWLGDQLGQPGRANLALSQTEPGPLAPTLGDLELTLRQTPDDKPELITPRIFIDASVERNLAGQPGQHLLTYMVNTIALGANESPYAMICASDGVGGLDLADEEIALNQWLADDLGARVGDTLELTYYLPDEGDRLIEASATLKVARIVPIEGAFADRTLTPKFPGLAEAQSLRRWDAGPAIDRSRIRDKDEAYWDDYRATPKAYINLQTGQHLWSNRFGTLTAIRFDKQVDEQTLVAQINPVALGIAVTDLRAQAEQAAVGTVDFGQLFLSLSGFIIIAAILLAAILFVMSVEQRARQLGLMLAIGLTRRQVTTLIVGEALVIAILGGAVGVLGGVGYAYAVLGALSGVWSSAIAGAAVQPHLTVVSLTVGPFAAVVLGVLVIALSVRALSRRPARSLMSGAVGKVSGPPRLSPWVWACLAVLLLGAGVATAVIQQGGSPGMVAALVGFVAGALVLAGLLSGQAWLLVRCSAGRQRGKHHPASLTTARFAMRNMTRRRGRTLAAVCTLSCGVFLVIAVAGFRLGSIQDPTHRASGTGGFALMVESSQPIRYDLNTTLGRDHYALSEDELPPGLVVPLRMSDGDDASCLNLNQTPTPRLLGVDPALLQERQAFTFMQQIKADQGWAGLSQPTTDTRVIPAIADANTAQWALKLAVGDTRTLTDERGQSFTIKLVGTIENTILQGSLIISEANFKRLYPSASGHRLLLVDATDDTQRDELAGLLSDVLVDEGVSITPTTDRLTEYNTVQNTYLSIFQSLGGLGVVLGAMGLGVIAARDVLERRSELALLFALGHTRSQIRGVMLLEKGLVLVLGLLFGTLSAAAATLHTGQPLGGATLASALTLPATLAAGALAVLLGLSATGLKQLPQALRND